MDRKRMFERYRVGKPSSFKLSQIDPGDTLDLDISKKEAKEALQGVVESIAKLQETMYAQDEWSLLVVLQAMDAAGKDSALEHVFSGVNPQGFQVHSFKSPTSTELEHDFLWRTTLALPERGRIGVFNRSYYEEVLVVRVRPEILGKQRLPAKLTGKAIWDERYESIRDFEKHMTRNGTRVLKFFLHVSKEEQKQRFLDRINEPDKNWKFNPGDLEDRKLWDKYMAAYEEAIRNTSTADAPWHVVPADKKWFARLVIAHTIADALENLGLEYPKVDAGAREALKKAKAALEAEK
jgi:PPK2 family polyphosphate:nucleotide phosphotransferase